eukprot:TRINITY_DN6849_c0_g1_i10.p2 TRINITY_DN6849_c0_g1~~TRINITY_DN6849_c0_g1_i10.p2  ORF type:complete len:240 (-),score=59.45 TRINITY_DN6849_c0_g1_i10:475-1194(-)
MHMYGGPGSQTVTKKWNLGFNEYLVSSLGFTVASVDNSGTGGRGIDFLQKTYLRLGFHEVNDQIAVASWLKDKFGLSAVGIWGWSYGGFMTLSSLLRPDSGFSCGMSVAPVAEWQLYDSIYTERYMQTPAKNPSGYNLTSVITQILERRTLPKFLLVHGTGDDNVHFQNSAALNEALVRAGIQYDTMIYTNQNHAINTNGAHQHIYRLLSNWIQSCMLSTPPPASPSTPPPPSTPTPED